MDLLGTKCMAIPCIEREHVNATLAGVLPVSVYHCNTSISQNDWTNSTLNDHFSRNAKRKHVTFTIFTLYCHSILCFILFSVRSLLLWFYY